MTAQDPSDEPTTKREDGEPARHDAARERRPVSGPGMPVDHERPPGVPPPSNDDYDDDRVDHESAESFPASDPPSGW